MTRRQVGHLLIWMGIGPVILFLAATWFVWFHHMFVIGVQWRPALLILAIPPGLIVLGSTLLYRDRNSN